VDSTFAQACRAEWARLCRPQDPTGLQAEGNAFRYRPLRRVELLAAAEADPADIDRARAAAAAVGVDVAVVEHLTRPSLDVDKIRFVGPVATETHLAAIERGTWIDDIPVAKEPGRELLRWVREQAVSESRHRHGDVTRRRPGLV
jgi:RHH-type proline utilization regulon transcriptional repressor/proline dehydrogenase/delta 1-pyrroline-5-carboxylate dehydrogenase